MTRTQYNRHSALWFKEQRAYANRKIQNVGGGVIASGERVKIYGKSRGGFYIFSERGISVRGVDPEGIDLLDGFPKKKRREKFRCGRLS